MTGDFDFFLILNPWPLLFFGSEHQGDNMSIFQRMCSTMFLFFKHVFNFLKIVVSPFLFVCSSSANENGFYLIHSKNTCSCFHSDICMHCFARNKGRHSVEVGRAFEASLYFNVSIAVMNIEEGIGQNKEQKWSVNAYRV